MIRQNRQFERKAPSKDAIVYYIFCEGASREPEYFSFFTNMSSQIKLEIIPPKNNQSSPDKLYQSACGQLVATEANPSPKYELADVDQVWFVIDSDQWGKKIDNLRRNCQEDRGHPTWQIAQSNPCFEVWLYYHLHEQMPNFDDMHIAKKWKTFVNNCIPGGFDSRKHPVHIQKAISNAQANYVEEKDEPKIGSTQVFKLAASLHPFIKETIQYN